MRIMGFSRKWGKLKNDTFTTFRFKRRDADWQVNEQVQIVYKPRSKDREYLGIAEIIGRELKVIKSHRQTVLGITDEEAIEDGFEDYWDMKLWLFQVYGSRCFGKVMNKLTLRWVERRRNEL